MLLCGVWKKKSRISAGRMIGRRYIFRDFFACAEKKFGRRAESLPDALRPSVGAPAALYQKFILMPNCIVRGPRSLLSWPNWPLPVKVNMLLLLPVNPELPSELPNPLKFGWLKMLKN